MSIRNLDPSRNRDAVAGVLAEAQDYYRMWLGRPAGAAETDAVFTAAPPGCDPAQSYRLGLFLDDRLSGVAELSFDFPATGDAFLGLMILAPRARSAGHGTAFHEKVLALARDRGCRRIFLAVLEANRRGRAFWQRSGYVETGVTRHDAETGHLLHRMGRAL